MWSGTMSARNAKLWRRIACRLLAFEAECEDRSGPGCASAGLENPALDQSQLVTPMFALVRCRRTISLLLAALSLTMMGAKSRPKRPLVIAHRGASHDAPENTLAAFNLAWQQGADGAEGDFYLSADGEIVCIHDGTTERTAGVNKQVAGSTLAELRQLDVGSWKSAEFANERIPTLSEVLQTVPAGKLFYIEIKCGPEIVPPLRELLHRQRFVLFDQLRIISFNADVISAVRQQLPAIKAFWLTGYREEPAAPPEGADNVPPAPPTFSPSSASVLETLARTGANGLGSSANLDVVTSTFAEGLRQAGKELHVWTVDDPEKALQLYQIGAQSITTNVPATIRALWPADEITRQPPPSPAVRVPCWCPPRRRFGRARAFHPSMFPRVYGNPW